MNPSSEPAADADPITVPCPELDEALRFLTTRLGFRLDTVFPADAPRVAVVSGHGLRLRLQGPDAVGGSTASRAPVGGIEVHRQRDGSAWTAGRAGMRYRDLIGGRLGGRCIASRIRIDVGGPVADYVHYHDVAWQVICCIAGNVKVVYEDQGPPFVMRAGDCVLQPPRIRHRVLEASAGLEVIEFTSPAEHPTHVDHDLELPTADVRPTREFDGQRFVRHVAADATWSEWHAPGFMCQETAIADATDGALGLRMIRTTGLGATRPAITTPTETIYVVLDGALAISAEGLDHELSGGDCVVVPPDLPHTLATCTPITELLEVYCLRIDRVDS